MRNDQIEDLDDEGNPFDMDRYLADLGFGGEPFEPKRRLTPSEEAYLKKIGLTKKERESKDPWAIARTKAKNGGIITHLESALDIRPANDWMQRVDESVADASKLFGDFWLEGELCILFADTGKGKSILAVQIAESLARGRPIDPFEMTWTAPPTKGTSEYETATVLFLDFELSTQQFNRRYSGKPTRDGGRFVRRRFHDNFIRAQLRVDQVVPPAFKDLGAFLAHSILDAVQEYESRVLIIDNITWLRTSNTNASAALSLMQELKALKSREDLSILVLAHTPKRPFARPLTVNDLAGNKMLSNFADSVFAIGESIQGPNVRYLKQIKPRSTEMIYDASNVAIARIEKPSNFLKFTFTGFAGESEHLIRTHHRLRASIGHAKNSPPCIKGDVPRKNSPPHEREMAAASADGVVLSMSDRFYVDGNISADQAEFMEAENLRQFLIAQCKAGSARGLSLRDIAASLGIGVTTVRKYLSE